MNLDKLVSFNSFVLTLILFLFSCNTSDDIKINGFTMGTTYRVTIRNFNDSSEKLKIEIEKLLADISNVFSTYMFLMNIEICS